MRYYVPWQQAHKRFSSSSKRNIQELSLVIRREGEKIPCVRLTLDLSLSHSSTNWTKLKRDNMCFARISLFSFLINCFRRSPMLRSEPISELSHIKLLLTDINPFVIKKWTSNAAVFNRRHTSKTPRSFNQNSYVPAVPL